MEDIVIKSPPARFLLDKGFKVTGWEPMILAHPQHETEINPRSRGKLFGEITDQNAP
jgi:hypothetical protein